MSVWNRGGYAGTFTVNVGDASHIVARLMPCSHGWAVIRNDIENLLTRFGKLTIKDTERLDEVEHG